MALVISKRAWLSLAGLILLAACGGSKAKPLAVAGDSLVLTGQGDLVEMALPSGERRVLVHFEDATVIDASVSKDGQHLAFVKVPKFTPNRTDFGTDVYIADRDGSNPTLVAQHSIPNELLRWPAIPDDSQTLVFQVQGVEAVNGVPVSRLDRIDLKTKARSVLIEPGRSPALSLDGRTVVYQVSQGENNDTIWAADAMGGSRRAVLSSGPKVGSFGTAAPSPDGSKIVFGAAEVTAAAPPSASSAIYVSFGAGVTVMNGLPEDAWLINRDGTGLQRLAALAEDLPSFTWSGDGKQVYVMGGNGLLRIDATTGAKTRVGDGIPHGQIVWGSPAPAK